MSRRTKGILIFIGLLLAGGIILSLVFRKPTRVDKSLATYRGKLEDYQGDKRLIVAFTASWASVWKLSAEELKKLDFSRFDLCILDEAVDRAELKRHGIDFLPTIALIEEGRITKRVQNMTNIDQIKHW